MKRIIYTFFLLTMAFTAIGQTDQLPSGNASPLSNTFKWINPNDTTLRQLYIVLGKSGGLERVERFVRFNDILKYLAKKDSLTKYVTSNQLGDSLKSKNSSAYKLFQLYADSLKNQLLTGRNTYSGLNTYNGQSQFQNEADFQNPAYFNNSIHVSGVPTLSGGSGASLLVVDDGNEMKRAIAVSSIPLPDSTLKPGKNLYDVTNASVARANIAAGSAAQQVTNVKNIATNTAKIAGVLNNSALTGYTTSNFTSGTLLDSVGYGSAVGASFKADYTIGGSLQVINPKGVSLFKNTYSGSVDALHLLNNNVVAVWNTTPGNPSSIQFLSNDGHEPGDIGYSNVPFTNFTDAYSQTYGNAVFLVASNPYYRGFTTGPKVQPSRLSLSQEGKRSDGSGSVVGRITLESNWDIRAFTSYRDSIWTLDGVTGIETRYKRINSKDTIETTKAFKATGLMLNIPGSGIGDTYYRNSVGLTSRLAIGGGNTILTGGTTPTWTTGSSLFIQNSTAGQTGSWAINGSGQIGTYMGFSNTATSDISTIATPIMYSTGSTGSNEYSLAGSAIIASRGTASRGIYFKGNVGGVFKTVGDFDSNGAFNLPLLSTAGLLHNSSSGLITSSLIQSADLPASLAFTGTTTFRHIGGTSTAPTIAANAGAGTSPTVSISGTDLSGTITVTTGTSPTANTAIATVTFNSAYTTAPRVGGNPAAKNTTTATLSATSPPFYTTTTGTLIIMGNTSALAASTTYVWDYTLTQ
jgi:hypothetical protein